MLVTMCSSFTITKCSPLQSFGIPVAKLRMAFCHSIHLHSESMPITLEEPSWDIRLMVQQESGQG